MAGGMGKYSDGGALLFLYLSTMTCMTFVVCILTAQCSHGYCTISEKDISVTSSSI